MNCRLLPFCLVLVLLLSKNTCFGQSNAKGSKFTPSPFEVTAAIVHVPIYNSNNATVGDIAGRGYMIEAGYRPNISNRRLLLAGYLFHVPKNNDSYNQVPQINSFGLKSSYLLIDPKKRFNLFFGLGFWNV